MSKLSLQEIEDRVRAIVAASPLRHVLTNVRIEPEVGPDGEEYLRVILEAETPNALERKQALGVTNDIEDAFAGIEERFPSVRFAKAA